MNEFPVLDPRPLQDLLDIGAGEDLIRELFGLLEEDAPARIEGVRRGLETGDEGLVLQEAHQLKGALGNLGLLRFAELARQVEALARAGTLAPAVEVAAAFPEACDEALAALRAAFPGILEG